MQEKLQQAINDLQNVPKVNIHGKPYTSVATRVEVFRRHFPEASLTTEIIHDDEQRVVIKSTISMNDIIIASGYAEELRGSGKINSTSALENAETSAIGRSLASMGIHGGEYASHNEVQHAVEQQNNMTQQTTLKRQHHPAPQVQDFSELTKLGLQVQEFNGEIILEGKTYGKQETIKGFGFRWDANRKIWYQKLKVAA